MSLELVGVRVGVRRREKKVFQGMIKQTFHFLKKEKERWNWMQSGGEKGETRGGFGEQSRARCEE